MTSIQFFSSQKYSHLSPPCSGSQALITRLLEPGGPHGGVGSCGGVPTVGVERRNKVYVKHQTRACGQKQ